jgi:hypothetical protein
VFPGVKADEIYSISDKGIKRWLLKSNSKAELFTESNNEKYAM